MLSANRPSRRLLSAFTIQHSAFAPDDPNAEPHPEIPWGYTVEDGWHLTISGGANPPRAWVESESLTEGSRHRCIRHHLIKPTAMPSPVTIFFPDLDYSAAIDACWK